MIRLLLAIVLFSTAAYAQPGAAPAPDPTNASPEPEPEAAPEPPPPPPPTPFDQGKFGLGFGFSSQTYGGKRYSVISGGLGYYVLDGLELGLGAAHQFGDPDISRLTPAVRYVAQPLVGKFPLIPYIGVFGSRYFIYSGIEDVHSVGGRVGAIYVSGSLLLGLGLAVERIVSECDDEMQDCTSYYPDITFSLSL